MESTLLTAAELLQGTLHGSDGTFRGVSTDTRTLNAGELFFALRGPNYDGEQFIGRAAAGGAAGAVTCDVTAAELPVIKVADTRGALGLLAGEWRRKMTARLVGLTGSNGKTTLKELIAACLSMAGSTLATRGNLNNDIGVPLMLAEMEAAHRFAVIEMGANHTGEIAYLTSLAQPQIAVITNAAAAHLEGFGSIEAVARAKGEILQGTPGPEWSILNADDRFFSFWKKLASRSRIASFGLSRDADFHAVDVTVSSSGSRFRLIGSNVRNNVRNNLRNNMRNNVGTSVDVVVTLPLAGKHNVVHACAAAAVASVLGVDGETIRAGLESVTPVSGRLRPLPGIAGVTVYDDSYNANPASTIAAAEFVADCEGEGWLVLGDMRELGDDAAALHRSVGAAARKAGVARLFATGPLSRLTAEGFGSSAAWYETVDELLEELTRTLQPGVNVLVKGSRSMQMERVVHALQNDSVDGSGT